ncbi:MAG: RNA pseudouridine synthase, partial [Candidatus Omnitrophota bacterium]
MVYNFTVSQEDLSKRLDLFLTDKFKDSHSRTFIQRLILNKDILLNGRAVKPNHKLNLSDTIQVTVPESAVQQINPEDIKLKVIYEDDDILVIDKPSGLVVHPGAG